jgi:NAD dependent epimerase/dehydratase family enzyme
MPAVLPVPGFALRAAFGGLADEALLGGQRVVPRKLLDEGFQFLHADVSGALESALRAAA